MCCFVNFGKENTPVLLENSR